MPVAASVFCRCLHLFFLSFSVFLARKKQKVHVWSFKISTNLKNFFFLALFSIFTISFFYSSLVSGMCKWDRENLCVVWFFDWASIQWMLSERLTEECSNSLGGAVDLCDLLACILCAFVFSLSLFSLTFTLLHKCDIFCDSVPVWRPAERLSLSVRLFSSFSLAVVLAQNWNNNDDEEVGNGSFSLLWRRNATSAWAIDDHTLVFVVVSSSSRVLLLSLSAPKHFHFFRVMNELGRYCQY